MKKVELQIIALTPGVTQSQNYAVILQEVGGVRRLPIVIGAFEAQAIAVAIERMIPNRPLTHDLFKQTLEAYEVEIKEIVINNLLEGIFYARLLCVKNGLETEIDSRTSDAIALAVRYGCPIYTYEFILEHAGVVMQDDVEDEDDARKRTRDRGRSKNTLSSMNLETLQNKLNDALQSENYERAAQIRDEINRRES
jgi:uncharacterized protein